MEEFILQIVFEIIGAVLEGLFTSEWLTSETWEWFGFVGASAWLILSLGRVQRENKDWRAICSGFALLIGGLGLLVWIGYGHYQSSCVA